MFKKFTHIILGIYIGVMISAYALYAGSSNPGFQLLPLEQKFGTAPDNDANLEPIVHLADEKGKAFCTAFVVDANYAVTAAHCINEGGKLPKENLKILDESGKEVGIVRAVGFHNRSDLGLLKGNFKKFLPLPVNFYTSGFQVVKPMAACGFPYGQHKLICNMFVPMGSESFTVKGRGFLVPAMSGGPVIDVELGVAVGVNYAVGDDYSYVRPLQGFLGVFGLD